MLERLSDPEFIEVRQAMDVESTLLQQAEAIVRHVEAIRSILDLAEQEDIASSGLTMPQVAVMRQLSVEDGLSLKELSQRLGLAHSTVSGIVDRLEQRDLLHRRPDPADRRFTRIYVDPRVADYVNVTYYSRRSQVLAEVLDRIPPAERTQILEVFARVHDSLNAVRSQFKGRPMQERPDQRPTDTT